MSWIDPRTDSIHPRTDRIGSEKPKVNPVISGPMLYTSVRASEESLKPVVIDALEGKRVGRLLGEPTRRRPVLLRPASHRRSAVGRPASTCPWYVRIVNSRGHSLKMRPQRLMPLHIRSPF